LKIIIISKITA